MTARIITAPFTATVFSERHEGEFEVDAEVTGAVELRDETYDIRIQSVRVGIEVYRPAMVSARLIEQCETALVWAYEAAEASKRRNAKQVDDIVSAARAHVGVML